MGGQLIRTALLAPDSGVVLEAVVTRQGRDLAGPGEFLLQFGQVAQSATFGGDVIRGVGCVAGTFGGCQEMAVEAFGQIRTLAAGARLRYGPEQFRIVGQTASVVFHGFDGRQRLCGHIFTGTSQRMRVAFARVHRKTPDAHQMTHLPRRRKDQIRAAGIEEIFASLRHVHSETMESFRVQNGTHQNRRLRPQRNSVGHFLFLFRGAPRRFRSARFGPTDGRAVTGGYRRVALVR